MSKSFIPPVVCEVGPRDGFQNIKEFIPTELKLDITRRVLDAGVKYVQLTSFVHPKYVPQMSDAEVVSETLMTEYENVRFNALIPNLKGADRAYACGYRDMSYSMSVSEVHNLKNINRTHEQSFSELQNIIEKYTDINLVVGFSTAFGCPYIGDIPYEKVAELVERTVNMRVKTICLSDTTGVAYPTQIEKYFSTLRKQYPEITLCAHIHDSRNMGVVNSWLALKNGADYIETSFGGLGGCPFAPGASGNVATEDFVYMLEKCSIDTGIDFNSILNAALYSYEHVNGNYSGHQIKIDRSYNCAGV